MSNIYRFDNATSEIHKLSDDDQYWFLCSYRQAKITAKHSHNKKIELVKDFEDRRSSYEEQLDERI